MKDLKFNFSYLLMVFFLLFSCAKDGEMGPKGEEGKQGMPGIQGIKGADGNTILSGSTDPTPSIGKEGDFYLNVSTQRLFGPKKGDDWGEGVDLNGKDGVAGVDGKDGANGKDGSTIYSGNTVPESNIGRLGDFYINLFNMDFYGPKTNVGWGTPISLRLNDAALSKRILIKQNFGYSKNCNECTGYSSSGNFSTYSATSAYERINTGNIQEYYDRGVVVYEASINGGSWILLDPTYNKEVQQSFRLNNRDYIVAFIPATINYYRNTGQLFVGSFRMITASGNYSRNQLISWLDNDVRVDIRITLLPKESIEYLSKIYPSNQINDKFLARYLIIRD